MFEAKILSRFYSFVQSAVLFIVIGMIFAAAPLHAAGADTVSAVSFSAADGWKITGTLYLPGSISAPIPAVVLLTEPGWVDRSIYDNYVSRKLAKNGLAALSIDMRGTGGSAGGKEFEAFSPEELAKLQLDV